MNDTGQNHDDMLFQMLKECKTLPNFLMKYLDFYNEGLIFITLLPEPNAAVGLPEGLSENWYDILFYKWKPQSSETLYTSTDIPTCAEETVITECDDDIWWNCLLKSEPELDISTIDCTRPYEDLPEEAQAKIQELQWNQERKRLGLPTSEEIVMQDKLKKAWNAEGSPFSGPFDPNAVVFN
ncbi:hypothetical protein NQ318_016681 [Aromia moschata]|uniref:NudC domain-containing protein 3 n=1 Tax=Aromia moschata TaxID=1265417 RepID=A0AAV8Y4V8_9CUCU|nr:hypothetical protein NQ318_016681 [Aromia moschata]